MHSKEDRHWKEGTKPLYPGYSPIKARTRGIYPNIGHRKYKCPKCNGEFDYWNRGKYNTENSKCPFCGLEEGKYEPPKTTDPETYECPQCKSLIFIKGNEIFCGHCLGKKSTSITPLMVKIPIPSLKDFIETSKGELWPWLKAPYCPTCDKPMSKFMEGGTGREYWECLYCKVKKEIDKDV